MPALPAETSTLVSILLSGRMTPPPVTPPPCSTVIAVVTILSPTAALRL